MTATCLAMRLVPKVWGRRTLPSQFAQFPQGTEPIGEIIYSDPRFEDAELLVKYLFTSERLSIQVHPDERTARAAGYKRGKDEAWFIVSADPGATIGLGLTRPLSPDELRAAALDGTIEDAVEWRPVAPGDFFYSPSGTIHAIGGGVSLVEIQQNVDVTYRLYDYGRQRELHLEEGIAAARSAPLASLPIPKSLSPGRSILSDVPGFVVERWRGAYAGRVQPAPGRPVWTIPLAGTATLDGGKLAPGEVWIVEDAAELLLERDADLLLAYPGGGCVKSLRLTA